MSRSALSLFEGGRDGVLSRMRQCIQDKLTKSKNSIKELAEETGLEAKKLKRIKNGNEKPDYELFKRIRGPLNISIHEVLGSPSFNGTKEYWQKQRKEVDPIIFIGAAGGEKKHRHSGLSPQKQDKIELDLYVRLCAIEELNRIT